MTNPMNSTDQLQLLRQKVDEFSRQRDWEKFHTPKNLTMALTVEAAELMELFQWQGVTEPGKAIPEGKQQAVEHEVADIFIYLLRFCSVTGIDLLQAAESKLAHNSAKYPVDQVKGKSAKYTDY